MKVEHRVQYKSTLKDNSERNEDMDTVTALRPVRIHLAMKDGSLLQSIRQVLPIVSNESSHIYVESVDEADLVIFTEVRDIEKGYSKEKSYAYLRIFGHDQSNDPTLPANCVGIDLSNVLMGLISVISDVRKKIALAIETTSSVTEETVPLRLDALRILVIDDTSENIASAKKGLAGHRFTTATGYEDAMNILGNEKFDVVLTDLHLPMSSKTMGAKFVLGQLVPYGILLMIEAARQGAKHVAVVTDLSHHDDPFSAAFDYYSQFSVQIEKAKVMMMHAPMKDGVKDWATALKLITKEF